MADMFRRTYALALLILSVCLWLPQPAGAADIVYDPLPSKGGLGAIDTDIFVSLHSDANKLILGPLDTTECRAIRALPRCRRKWTGGTASAPETVFTDGLHASKSATGLDLSRLVIIMFYPNEVKFVNLRNNKAGSFTR